MVSEHFIDISEKLTTKNIYKDVMAYSDGKTDLIKMAELFEANFCDVSEAVQILLKHKLIRIVK